MHNNYYTLKCPYCITGRLIQEGNKSYTYGWLDKVLSVTENGQQIASFGMELGCRWCWGCSRGIRI